MTIELDLTYHGDPAGIRHVAREIEERGGVGALYVPEGNHDAFVYLTLAAIETTNLRLGTSIALPTLESDLTPSAAAEVGLKDVATEVPLEVRPGTQSGAEITLAGHGVPEGQVSLAVEIELQPQEKSFTDAELKAVADKVVAAAAKLGATLRG